MATPYKHAIVKFNGGFGALLCNKCFHIIKEDFDIAEIEDREHLCKTCEMNANWVIRGINARPVTAELITTIDLSRRPDPHSVHDVLDGPDQECFPLPPKKKDK